MQKLYGRKPKVKMTLLINHWKVDP